MFFRKPIKEYTKKGLKAIIFYMSQLTLALKMLKKIQECYPYVYGECITDEEDKKIVEKYNDK